MEYKYKQQRKKQTNKQKKSKRQTNKSKTKANKQTNKKENLTVSANFPPGLPSLYMSGRCFAFHDICWVCKSRTGGGTNWPGKFKIFTRFGRVDKYFLGEGEKNSLGRASLGLLEPVRFFDGDIICSSEKANWSQKFHFIWIRIWHSDNFTKITLYYCIRFTEIKLKTRWE